MPEGSTVTVDVERAGQSRVVVVGLVGPMDVRAVVRSVGLAPEGAAVLVDGRPVPLDRPVRPGERLRVIPTFSGG